MVSEAAVYADLTALVADLRYAHQNIDRVSEEILDETAVSVEALMKEYAPVKSGRLRNSIRIVSAPGVRTIGPVGVEYAAYQEWGTGIRGEFPTQAYVIRPKNPGGKLHFKVDGKHVTASEVHHPGIPANPFVRPAGRKAVAEIHGKYAQAGADLIMKGKKSA